MVHCKQQPRAKPRDDAGGRARAAAVAVAPASSAPGYMRPTSSSGARVSREAAAASAPAAPSVGAKARPVSTTPQAARATCSSAQKSAWGGGGCEGGHRACRYAYCSFKGHAPAPPPLGAFVAARRRLIKTEQTMKHRGVSAFRTTTTTTNKAANADAGPGGFFVPGARPKTASSGSCCSGLSAEEAESPYVNFDRRSFRDDDKWADPGASVDGGSCGSSDVISDGFADLPVGGGKGGIDQEEAEEEDSGACGRSDISEELGARYQGNNMSSKDYGGQHASVDSSMDDISSAFGGMNFQDVCADPADLVDQQEAEEDFGACRSDISEELGATYQGNNMSKDFAAVDSSMDDISSAFGGMNFQDVGADPAATSQGNKSIVSRRRTPKGGQRIRAFNPRAPNFLPLVSDPDAEKVDLRHQMTDDRKNAEEWMVDYALRRTVKKLARAQKRKVEMLVQAFETVLPPVPGEKSSLQQDDDKKSLAKCN